MGREGSVALPSMRAVRNCVGAFVRLCPVSGYLESRWRSARSQRGTPFFREMREIRVSRTEFQSKESFGGGERLSKRALKREKQERERDVQDLLKILPVWQRALAFN